MKESKRERFEITHRVPEHYSSKRHELYLTLMQLFFRSVGFGFVVSGEM